MTRYNRDWLIGIEDTRHLIAYAPIDKVPFPYRATIKRQFEVCVRDFKRDLESGLNTTHVQADIADLAYLALELVEEHEKAVAKQCAAAAHPAYGR